MKSSGIRMPSVPGFKVSGLACGIKGKGQKDLALIVSDTPAAAAAVFTRNRVQSPSVVWSRQVLQRSGRVRAVLVSSGNANACVGPRGLEDCRTLAEGLAEQLGLSPREILIAATGIIGVPLPVNKIIRGFPDLARTLAGNGWKNAAEAIQTTDLTLKTGRSAFTANRRKVVIGGIAKGSGMIHPNMATMLAFIATDAVIEPGPLRQALREATDASFNRITVDGDCSTNDTVMVLANGQGGHPPLKPGTSGYRKFVEELTGVCRSLAFQIVEDGEGATKFVTVRVRGARTQKHALQAAFKVAQSSLVKTALFGEDPNWGRILCAVGNAGIPLNPDRVDITLNKALLVKNGAPVRTTSAAALKKQMRKKAILIDIHLHGGREAAEVYTCDLSYDYVRINAEYTT